MVWRRLIGVVAGILVGGLVGYFGRCAGGG
jgi:hypothetical protein